MNTDVIAELLTLSRLSGDLCKSHVNHIARLAAAEIGRLRGDAAGHAAIDFNRRVVIDVEGNPWRPTPQQWLILARLLRSPGIVVSYDALVDALYGHDPGGGAESAACHLRVVVSKIRRHSPWPIINTYGVGYVLEGYRASWSAT